MGLWQEISWLSSTAGDTWRNSVSCWAIQDVFRIKGRNNFNIYQFKESFLKLFFDIAAADLDALFASLHPLPKDGGKVFLGDGPDDPPPAVL